MPHKLPEGLTYRDLQVFAKVEQEGKTLDQAAEELGVSRDTIKRTKKRGSYRDLTLAAMEELGYTVEDYTKKLIGLTDAKKMLNFGGHNEIVDDNVTQLKAIEKIGKVYGDNADVGVNVRHDMGMASDEELMEALADVDEK